MYGTVVTILLLLNIYGVSALCPSGWLQLNVFTSTPCQCVYYPVSPPGVTYLAQQQYCLSHVDNRSKLLEANGDSDVAAAINYLGPIFNLAGVSNLPVGLYLDDAGKTSVISTSTVIPKWSGFTGKCGFIFTTGNLQTNGSCLKVPTYCLCTIPCAIPPYPPPPTIGPNATRCNNTHFNMTCPSGWINLGGLCYINPVDSNTLVTYAEAVTACQNVGGWLPSFSNLNEWQAVMNYAYYVGISGVNSWAAPMWLGGQLSGTTASWTDGTPWSFEYWAPTQPNTTRTCIWWSVGQGNYWSSGNCSTPGVVFCQWYQPCFTTSTTSTSTTTTTTSTPITTSTISSTNQKYCTTGEQNQTSEFRNLYIKQVKQTIMYIYDWNLQYVPQDMLVRWTGLLTIIYHT